MRSTIARAGGVENALQRPQVARELGRLEVGIELTQVQPILNPYGFRHTEALATESLTKDQTTTTEPLNPSRLRMLQFPSVQGEEVISTIA